MPKMKGEWKMTKSEMDPLNLTFELEGINTGSVFNFIPGGRLEIQTSDTLLVGSHDNSRFEKDSTIYISSGGIWSTNIKLIKFEDPVATFELNTKATMLSLPVPNQFGSPEYTGLPFELTKVEN